MNNSVLIIGGGAAGLFLATRLAGSLVPVTVLERRERPARKLLITGKGRCNLTNLCTPQEFTQNVVRGGRFLQSATRRFTPEDTMSAFEDLGVPLVVERGRRVFPESQRAMDIVDALVKGIGTPNVQLLTGTAATVEKTGDGFVVTTEGGETYSATYLVLATGGLSYPETGSTGDGYRFAEHLGHTTAPRYPALTAVGTVERDCFEAAGFSLRNVNLSLLQTGKKKPLYSQMGEALITHTGLSGPLLLTVSSLIEPDKMGEYTLLLDLKPATTPEALERRLMQDILERQNQEIQNALGGILPRALIPAIVARAGVPPYKKAHSITKEERRALVTEIKGMTFHPIALGDYNEAVITRGGVSLQELDPKTMGSKLCPGLYCVGELLDADALTGGYNLQIAFATAAAAAADILQKLTV